MPYSYFFNKGYFKYFLKYKGYLKHKYVKYVKYTHPVLLNNCMLEEYAQLSNLKYAKIFYNYIFE